MATKLDRLSDYYTIPALADLLGVPTATLEGYLWRHKVPATMLGTTRLIKLADLDDFKVRLKNARKLLQEQ